MRAEDRAANRDTEHSQHTHSLGQRVDTGLSSEETIETRVARIKARVSELTGQVQGTSMPMSPPQEEQRHDQTIQGVYPLEEDGPRFYCMDFRLVT